MKQNRLICSLRKVCETCGKLYGRKLRNPGYGSSRLESTSNWKRSKYCSLSCKSQANVVKAKKNKEELEIEKELEKTILAGAFNDFLYTVPE